MVASLLGASLVVGLPWSAAVVVDPAAAGAAATGTGTTGSGAASGQGLLTLLGQTTTVQPPATGPATFTLDLGIGARTPSGAEVGLTLYRALTSPSRFQQTLHSSTPPGSPLTHVDPVAVADLPARGHHGVALAMDVVPSNPSAAGAAAGTPVLDLRCTPAQRSCTGVYPVVVTLYPPGRDGGTLARFTTYLTYVQEKSTATAALRFAWVVPVAGRVTIKDGARDPGGAVAPPSKATTTALAGLVTSLDQYPQVPVTLEPSPQTLQGLAAEGGAGEVAADDIRAMSHDSPSTREIPPQSYVPIDLGALAAAGETGEITGQMTQGATVLRNLGVQAGTSRTWVATGAVGNALGTGLADAPVAATRVVVPDDQLASATPATRAETWSSTFQLSFTGGAAAVPAAAADTELATHFTSNPKDPALEAAQLLADLAMIHFELPFAKSRGVVAVPPSGWVPDRTFDAALLRGLATNPIITPVTLDGFFDAVHNAGARHLQASGAGPTLPRALAHQISTARLRLTGFDTAVRPRSTPVLAQLDQLLLASEAASLPTARQSAGVATFNQSLDGQLSEITFATSRNITMTARTGSIPITIVSSAPYRVVGRLSVSGAKFQFPQGSSQKLTIDHPTTPVRFQVEALSSGDLPIQAQLDTADGNLVIAQGQFTVRSTATSIVGIVLTAVALAVLLAWWARTWIAGRRRRHAARAQRVPGG